MRTAMTDDEFERANAAYDALPSTPPDGYSFIPEAELLERGRNAMRERMDLWRPEMAFARWTDMTGEFAKEGWPKGMWLEVWREQPRKQAAFNPPLTSEGLPAPSGSDGIVEKETGNG